MPDNRRGRCEARGKGRCAVLAALACHRLHFHFSALRCTSPLRCELVPSFPRCPLSAHPMPPASPAPALLSALILLSFAFLLSPLPTLPPYALRPRSAACARVFGLAFEAHIGGLRLGHTQFRTTFGTDSLFSLLLCVRSTLLPLSSPPHSPTGVGDFHRAFGPFRASSCHAPYSFLRFFVSSFLPSQSLSAHRAHTPRRSALVASRALALSRLCCVRPPPEHTHPW